MSSTATTGAATRLASRSADAGRVAAARLDVAVADIFLSQPGRLDDRTRWTVLRLAETTVNAIEQQIVGGAARALATRGWPEAAAILESNQALAWPRLLDTGLMRDAEVIAELIAQARIDLLDQSLTVLRAPDGEPTLVAMLADGADVGLRQAALAYMVADGRRRLSAGERHADLPAALQARVTWWVAAALRERLGDMAGFESDVAICDAAQRCVGGYGDDERVEAAAARLAALLHAAPDPRGELLLHALESARATLFVALLAAALSIDAADARALLLDPESDRLWLAMRAAGMSRDAIARAGFLLTEADRARDLDALIELLDPLAALDPATAAAAVAPLTLPADYRAALRALNRDQVR